MNNEIKKIVNNNINTNSNDIDKYLRKKEREEHQQKIKCILELLKNNPNITEEMIAPGLRKYLGIVRRELKKEMIEADFIHRTKKNNHKL